MIEPKTMAGPVGEDSYTRHNDITLEERDPWTTDEIRCQMDSPMIFYLEHTFTWAADN